MLEEWNLGILDYWVRNLNIIPLLQTPITPALREMCYGRIKIH
jgi:hypothetical protein